MHKQRFIIAMMLVGIGLPEVQLFQRPEQRQSYQKQSKMRWIK